MDSRWHESCLRRSLEHCVCPLHSTVFPGRVLRNADSCSVSIRYLEQSLLRLTWCSCANIAWELIYGVFYPPGLAETIAFLPWVFIDLVLVYTTVKFGPREWKGAPLVAQNLQIIIAVGSAMMLAAHGTFVQLFDDQGVACFWAGYACQVVVSWSSLWQLVSRGSTRGHSMSIW